MRGMARQAAGFKGREPDDMRESDVVGEPRAVETPSAAALYIATLTDELAQIARRHGLESLSYILDMARLEADQIAKSSADARRRA
jgi:hypothetical protein